MSDIPSFALSGSALRSRFPSVILPFLFVLFLHGFLDGQADRSYADSPLANRTSEQASPDEIKERLKKSANAQGIKRKQLPIASPEVEDTRVPKQAQYGMGVGRPKGFLDYNQKLQEKVKAKWKSKQNDKLFSCGVRVSIAEDGALRTVTINESSGNTEFDQHVIASIQTAAPFPPPPENLRDFFQNAVLYFHSLK